MEQPKYTYDQLQDEVTELRLQLEEANDTIHAIRTGQVDAFIVQGEKGHQLYTLKTADQTYRMFIEKMNEGAVTINREGLILYCNTKFANMVGVPLKKVIGLAFNTFIHPDAIEKFDAMVENAWQDDCKEEIELLKSNGKGL